MAPFCVWEWNRCSVLISENWALMQAYVEASVTFAVTQQALAYGEVWQLLITWCLRQAWGHRRS